LSGLLPVTEDAGHHPSTHHKQGTVKSASSINSSPIRYGQKSIIHQLITNKVQSKVHHPSTHHQQGTFKSASSINSSPTRYGQKSIIHQLITNKVQSKVHHPSTHHQ
jgi:hypothetical protein